jgi:hypothetical protein
MRDVANSMRKGMAHTGHEAHPVGLGLELWVDNEDVRGEYGLVPRFLFRVIVRGVL